MNPVSRILAGLLAAIVLVAAFFFGMIILGVAVALGIVAWIFLSLRIWWARRQLDQQGAGDEVKEAGRQDAARSRARDVIEADYEVISRQKEE
jgi:predicted lipid-binding transport protein (Tim44 family)